MYVHVHVHVEVLKFPQLLCAGGEESLLSSPADTHSPSHERGPVEADSETDNRHAETTERHTGMYSDLYVHLPIQRESLAIRWYMSVDIFLHTTGPSSSSPHKPGKEHSPEPPAKRPRTDLGKHLTIWYQHCTLYMYISYRLSGSDTTHPLTKIKQLRTTERYSYTSFQTHNKLYKCFSII